MSSKHPFIVLGITVFLASACTTLVSKKSDAVDAAILIGKKVGVEAVTLRCASSPEERQKCVDLADKLKCPLRGDTHPDCQ